MVKKFFIILYSVLYLFFCKPVYSQEVSINSYEKYMNKISNKFSKTYCNTIKFGISNDGALEFALGETNKEFKNNKLNSGVDYSQLKSNIVEKLERNCEIYDFSKDKLENLKIQ